jgi:hypothetical protein
MYWDYWIAGAIKFEVENYLMRGKAIHESYLLSVI